MNPLQKVLTHDHLDGSYPLLAILPLMYEMSGKKLPFSEGNLQQEVKRWFRQDMDIREKFEVTKDIMQKRETLALAAQAYVNARAIQGCRYCELTIAPQYHTRQGLSEEEVIDALIEGIQEGESRHNGIEVNIIDAINREVEPDEAIQLVNAASRCNRDYVVGIGLVCDESAFPPERHRRMFWRAKDLGFKTTCHAGE